MTKVLNILILREMQVKTTMKYQLTPVSMAVTNNSTKNKCQRGRGAKGTLPHRWWDCKLVQPRWKSLWKVLRKVNVPLPWTVTTPLPGTYPEEKPVKRCGTPLFRAALLHDSGGLSRVH